MQDAPAKLCCSFVSICPCELEQCTSCLYCDFTINRLIHAWTSKMAEKVSSISNSCCLCIKIVSSYRILFLIRSKETLQIMYPKYLVLDMIQRIHLRFGSFGSIIRFWILVKKRSIRFRIKHPNLDSIK